MKIDLGGESLLQLLWHPLHELESSGCVKDVDRHDVEVRSQQLDISLTPMEDLHNGGILHQSLQA